MSTAVADRSGLFTSDDVLAMPDGDRYELVDGVLKEPCVSVESIWFGGNLYYALRTYARASKSAFVFPAEIQLRIWPNPNQLRKADVALVLAPRLPEGRPPTTGYLDIAPDIVGEVVSTRDEAEEVEAMISDYLDAGVQLVWVAFPRTRRVHIYRLDGTVSVLRGQDELDGAPVLPGFRMLVSELFDTSP